MEYENLRLWGYASAVDNGTHILLYYMVMSTLGQDPDKVAMYTALAISADRGASFVKPELGLVDVGDGGKNNIVWPLVPKTVSKRVDARVRRLLSEAMLAHKQGDTDLSVYRVHTALELAPDNKRAQVLLKQFSSVDEDDVVPLKDG